MIEHLRGRDRKLEPLGWTGQHAEWITLVCLHSGVFTRGQFCDYFGTGRPQALRFVRSLIQRREAVENKHITFSGGTRLRLRWNSLQAPSTRHLNAVPTLVREPVSAPQGLLGALDRAELFD